MDGSTSSTVATDRPFDPARVAIAPPSQQLVFLALDRIRGAENRARRRRADDQQRHDAAVAALVCDLAHCVLSEPGGRIIVSMTKGVLTAKKRTFDCMTENFPKIVRALEKLGIADLRLGRRGDGEKESRRTTLRASPWFVQELGRLGVTLRDFTSNKDGAETIVLKGPKVAGKAERLPLPDDPIVQALRTEMEELNAWLRAADVDCSVPTVDINNRHLRRIFNNASLECSGRLYGGFWQKNLSAEQRINTFTIGGYRVASVDFAQLGIVIAYSMVGAMPPDGDLYAIPLLLARRDGVKAVMNALLAQAEPATRFPKGTRKLFPRWMRFDDVREAIARHHEPIAPLFGTARALTIMHIESKVLLRALLQLKRAGVVALPLHDCVVVRDDCADHAKAVMEESFEVVAGARATAVIDRGES